MISTELAEQVRSEVRRMKQAADEFLQTWRRLCVQHGGPAWQKEGIEMVFHRVRSEVIPIMEEAGMDAHSVQALCSWAERLVMQR